MNTIAHRIESIITAQAADFVAKIEYEEQTNPFETQSLEIILRPTLYKATGAAETHRLLQYNPLADGIAFGAWEEIENTLFPLDTSGDWGDDEIDEQINAFTAALNSGALMATIQDKVKESVAKYERLSAVQ